MAELKSPWLRSYYYLTPLFLLLDLAGVNIRAVGLEQFPFLHWSYYLLCFACAATFWRGWSGAAWVSLAESAVNIFTLILGVFLSYWKTALAVSEGQTIASPIGMHMMANFVLAGSAALASFYGTVLAGSDRFSSLR